MCRSPIQLPTGQMASCRNCDRCKYNRVKDWIGRCIAESQTSVAAYAVTLTYSPLCECGKCTHGPEGWSSTCTCEGGPTGRVDRHERTAILTYSDIQKYLKRLRVHGYDVRYIVAGEYGKKKARTHWHLILFFQNKVPPVVLRPTFHWDEFWPHGHQLWDKADNLSAVRYVCKYITKDVADKSSKIKFNMSKVPAIGEHYFNKLASDMVKQGLAPLGPHYSFADARMEDGKPYKFYMRGEAANKFVAAWVAEWHAQRPGVHMPVSAYLEEWLDKQVEDWRAGETVAKLEEAAKLRLAMAESLARAEFVRSYNEYYFNPDHVKLVDYYMEHGHVQGFKGPEVFDPLADEAQYLYDLYEVLNKPNYEQERADRATFGDEEYEAARSRAAETGAKYEVFREFAFPKPELGVNANSGATQDGPASGARPYYERHASQERAIKKSW